MFFTVFLTWTAEVKPKRWTHPTAVSCLSWASSKWNVAPNKSMRNWLDALDCWSRDAIEILWFVKSSYSLSDKSQRVQRETNTIETEIRKHVNKVSWYIKSLLLMLRLQLMDVPYQKRGICCVKSQLLARHDVKGGKQTAGLRPQKAEICSFKSSWRTRWSHKST